MNDTHKYELYTRDDGKWDFRIWHVNGNIICSSKQGYENRRECLVALGNVAEAFRNKTIHERE